jgi:hypothetical protein
MRRVGPQELTKLPATFIAEPDPHNSRKTKFSECANPAQSQLAKIRLSGLTCLGETLWNNYEFRFVASLRDLWIGGSSLSPLMLKSRHKRGFLVALAFGVAISASGQGRGFSAPMRGFSRPVGGISRLAGAGGVSRGFVPPLFVSLHFPPTNGVPGLGFDFTHLAVVGAGLPRRFGFANGGFFPSFASVFFVPPPYDPPEAGIPYSETGQQPIIIVPSPQPTAAPPATETEPRATSSQDPPPPPPELGPLILVRRDGQVVQAVAFTVNRGQLIYIRRDGIRRFLPVGDLDKDGTRQVNDANGTSVSFPE